MFTLLVCAGEHTFAIDTARITEVIPLVQTIKIPHVPGYLLGHINFAGKPIPVADLSLLINNHPSAPCMSTRIVLLQTSQFRGPQFGLVSERVTETAEIDSDKFIDTHVHPAGLPFLGGVLSQGQESIQLLDVDKLYAFLELDKK